MREVGTTVVVVGSGAAGLSAALAVAEAAQSSSSDSSVILIERAPKGQHGGNTRWSPSYMRMATTDRIAQGFEEDVQVASGGRADAANRPGAVGRSPWARWAPPAFGRAYTRAKFVELVLANPTRCRFCQPK